MGRSSNTNAPKASAAKDKQKRGKRLKYAIVIACILAVCGIGFDVFSTIRSRIIPSGYVAVFHGGGAEVTRETYIYKKNNGHENYGFTYINTETIWGIDPKNATTKILKRGSFNWTDGAFSTAMENGAYSYVTIPDSNQRYTIEEFQERFLMN